MKRVHRLHSLALIFSTLIPTLVAAQTSQSQTASDEWQFALSVYGYLPSLSGTSSVPADTNGIPIDINAEKIVDALEFTAMGTFEAHNGSWGVITDFIYLNLGDSKQRSRDFTIGGMRPPAGTTADLNWDFKGTIWTLAGEYRVSDAPKLTMDLLAGARHLNVNTTTDWSITGDLGVLLPAGRTGSAENKETFLDAIVGIKGRVKLGSGGTWSMPFYVDIGTGDSDLTWQATTGVSYGFDWGDLTAQWRYLAYELDSGASLADVSFSGPLIGATWRW
ncbi:MAG: hypothetical protein K0Q78_2604 [Cellvibrio sp.]|jgi:hypothetical protein|nr:hypothetical protein [Cellvibrio sp.]